VSQIKCGDPSEIIVTVAVYECLPRLDLTTNEFSGFTKHEGSYV